MKNLTIIASPGGHLQEILNFENLFHGYNITYLTFYTPALNSFANYNKVIFIKDPARGIIQLFKNFTSSFLIIIKKRPDLVLSTGAGVALPFLIFSKIFGVPIIYFELKCQIFSLTKTGSIVRFFADYIFVQNEFLSKRYGIEYAPAFDNIRVIND